MRLKRFNKRKKIIQLRNNLYKESYLKNRTIFLSVGILILSIAYFTFAVFESNHEFEIVNASVGDFSNDISIVEIYQGENKTNSVPSKDSGFVFNNANCSNDALASWNSDEWSLIVSNNKKTKCTLYFTEPTQTAVEFINSLALTDDSLASDETLDNNLRYIGNNPNNYVLFNNELWRIVGAFNNIKNSSGEKNSLLKIQRAQSLGDYSWDSSSSSINEGTGINQWGPSLGYEGADLMRELNLDYLGTTMVGLDGKWYSSTNNDKEKDMAASSLSKLAQSMIETVEWKLGSPNNDNGSYNTTYQTTMNASLSYTRERSSTNGKVCSSDSKCNDTVTRTSTWIGKVALLYPSDYLYATSGGEGADRSTCLNSSISQLNKLNACEDNNWLYSSNDYQWTISPAANLYNSYSVFLIYDTGIMGPATVYGRAAIRPALFLKSSIHIISGDGTQNNPYKLG